MPKGVYPRTAETRRKISEAQQGKTLPEEHRRKISETLRGRTLSEEHSRKIAETQRGKTVSEETRRKMSEGRGDGRSKHPYYNRWRNMLGRCYKIDNPRYRRYGERGIEVCDAWHDFWTFVRYLDEELGPCPSGYSIDRIDNDGNYEPGNVRWATVVEQMNNKSKRQ